MEIVISLTVQTHEAVLKGSGILPITTCRILLMEEIFYHLDPIIPMTYSIVWSASGARFPPSTAALLAIPTVNLLAKPV